MRARNIKPGFFNNDILNSLEPLTRLLFIGLWCMADREGRLEDRPNRIRKEVLGYDDVTGKDVDNMLDELRKTFFIIRYEVEGKKYIQITNFTKHQNPHRREQESEIPGPGGERIGRIVESDENDDNDFDFIDDYDEENDKKDQTLTKDKPRTDQGQTKDKPCTVQAGLNPDILNPDILIPDFLNPDILIPEISPPSPPQGGPPPGGGDDTAADAKKPRAPTGESRFNEFWEAYPKKTGKKAALKAWKNAKVTAELFEQIMAAVAKAKKSDQWNRNSGQFIPHPATWLNQGRWDDVYEVTLEEKPSYDLEVFNNRSVHEPILYKKKGAQDEPK